MLKYLIAACLLFAGCAGSPETPDDLIYRQIPEAWLEECQLPPMPENNAELSDAFAQTYQCAEIGNKDKRRIRGLTTGASPQ